MTTPVASTASTSAHFKRIPPAMLRARYADDVPMAQIASEFGISVRALNRRAKNLGLSRGPRAKKPLIRQADAGLFASMWVAGVERSEVAAHFGISARTVANTCKRLALPSRAKGARPKLTLAQFFEAQLGELMAQQARIEQAHILNAEMADKIGARWVGAVHVRMLQIGGRP